MTITIDDRSAEHHAALVDEIAKDAICQIPSNNYQKLTTIPTAGGKHVHWRLSRTARNL